MSFFIGTNGSGDGDMEKIVYDQDENNVVDIVEGLMIWESGYEYKPNNVVIYNDGIWRCVENHTSGVIFDPLKFSNLTEIPASGETSKESGRVKIDVSDTLGFLKNKVDGTTIDAILGKLTVKSLEGLTSSVDELNFLKGAKSSVQAQIDSLSNVGNFTGSVDTKADLGTVERPNVSDLVIVLEDETKENVSTLYMYNGTKWIFSGEFKVELRDFTTNPIDLTIEVAGVLPITNTHSSIIKDTDIDVLLLNRLSEVDGALHFDGQPVNEGGSSEGGSVEWAEF